jgi:hypothetical protein
VLALFFSVLLGGVASAAYIHSTIEQYRWAVPCGPLKGVPGWLQKAHFIGVGNCVVDPNTGCNIGTLCSIANPTSGPAIQGTCQRVFSFTNPCACVAFPAQSVSTTSPQ